MTYKKNTAFLGDCPLGVVMLYANEDCDLEKRQARAGATLFNLLADSNGTLDQRDRDPPTDTALKEDLRTLIEKSGNHSLAH